MQCISSRLILHAVWFFRKIKHYLSDKWHHGYLEHLIWWFSSNSVVFSGMVTEHWKCWYCVATTETFFWYSTKEEKPTQSSWQGWNTLLTTQPTWWEQATTPIFCSAAVGHLLNFHSLHTICLLLIIYQLYNYNNFFCLIQIVAVINIATQKVFVSCTVFGTS